MHVSALAQARFQLRRIALGLPKKNLRNEDDETALLPHSNPKAYTNCVSSGKNKPSEVGRDGDQHVPELHVLQWCDRPGLFQQPKPWIESSLPESRS